MGKGKSRNDENCRTEMKVPPLRRREAGERETREGTPPTTTRAGWAAGSHPWAVQAQGPGG